MSSNAIAYALETIKTTSGHKAKKALLEVLAQEYPQQSARIMVAVFDVNVTYGFNKKIPDPVVAALKPGRRPLQFREATWELLGKLARRELAGDAAKLAVSQELGLLSLPSRGLLVCILQQNLRGGFGVDVVNEVWGNIVVVFDVCLAHNYEDYKAKLAKEWPVWADFKYDGLRGFRFQYEPTLVSRKRLPLSCPPELMTLMTEFLNAAAVYRVIQGYTVDELFLDCEIVSVNGLFRDALSNARASKKGAQEGTLMLRVIDLLGVGEVLRGQSDLAHSERREALHTMLSDPTFARFYPLIQLTEGAPCANDSEVQALFGKALGLGLEGLVVKWGFWESKRSFYWLKKKAKDKIEGRIVGYKLADPLSKDAGKVGSVWVELPSGVRTYVAGMTDKMRNHITAHQEHLTDAVVELEYHELTPDGVPRHPRIKAIRDDK